MNTIELAFQPFAQAANPARSILGRHWQLIAVCLLMVLILYMYQTGQEEAFIEDYAD